MMNRLYLVYAIMPFLFGRQSPADKFWGWFRGHEPRLLAIATGHEAIVGDLNRQLHAIHPDLTWEVGPPIEGRRDFVISAGGMKAAFPAVSQLASAAPPLSRWKVIAFRPARPSVTTIKIKGVSLDAHTLEFLAERNGTKTDLTISVPGYRSTPNHAYDEAVYLLLDGLVGEYAVEMTIGGIDIVPTEGRPTGHWQPFARIAAAVSDGPKP